MALVHLKQERQELTASNVANKVVVIGTLQKGEKLERGAKDLGWFVFKPEYGDAKIKDALRLAFAKKYGPNPKVIEPVYLPEGYWNDVNPDKQVCARAFHTIKGASHLVAEGNGQFITAYRDVSGGSLKVPTEPIPQPEKWPYTVKYTNKASGKEVVNNYQCPFKDTIQLTFILDGLLDYLPDEIARLLPYRLAVNFYSTAKNEVAPMYHALNSLRDLFVDAENPNRSVPCNVTPLALYRHEIEDKRVIENGQEQRILIYPTRLEMSKTLGDAFTNAQLEKQTLYLQYVSSGYLTTGQQKLSAEPAIPLAIAPPKPVQIKGDVNDLLFGDDPVSTHVEKKTKPVVEEIIDGDFDDGKEKRDIIKATTDTFKQLGLKAPENLGNNKEVLKALYDFNLAVGGVVKGKETVKDIVAKLMGEDVITNYWFENLLIYFFRTSTKCEEEFGEKDDLLKAKAWWDNEKHRIAF